jgi:6-phosphogluconolactonase (cycloisomerase 2 family)
MALLRSSLSAAVLCLLPGAAWAASSLLVSHYNGNIYTVTLSDAGQLSITSQISSGQRMPSWLTFDSTAKVVYSTEESTSGNLILASFNVAADGKLSQKASARAPGGELHSTLYGGADGKSYLAAAE